jgi:alkylhydroperoxidase family enzyme
LTPFKTISSRAYVKEAFRNGLNEQWIHLLGVWKESPIYDPQESALLGWVEAVSLIVQTGAPDTDFEVLKAHL